MTHLIPEAIDAPPAAGALLLTRSGAYPLAMRRAAGFFSRFAGLMLRRGLAPDAALLLADCAGVHTAFMRFSIDVVYLDRHGLVLKCVPRMLPWRVSASNAGRDASGRRHVRAAHTLELAAGAIARWDIQPGDALRHAPWFTPTPRQRQRGAAIIELAVVGPLLTMLGLGTVQYSQLFFAKNQLDHAAFLAARAGSVGNAGMAAIKQAYAEGLVPMFGGGQDAATLATSLAQAQKSVADHAVIQILNPTKEAFQDYNDPALQTLLDTKGKRVISNRGLAFKPTKVGAASGESIQDANLIKLRITHGVKPVVPIIASIYKVYLKWQDTGEDPARTKMIDDGLVPVVSNVTLQMQSDAIESDNPVSSPGKGNDGEPVNPGDPPVTADPPPDDQCGALGGCSTPPPGSGNTCPIPITTTLGADALFGFDQATLQPEGIKALDQLVASASAGDQSYDTLTVTGYTDPIGTEAYNLDLSHKRAAAVRDYLIGHGLKVEHVNVVGAGATDLITPPEACGGKSGAALQACYAPNRRVVVELNPKL